MKKSGWFNRFAVIMVLLSATAIPSPAPAALPAVKVVELTGAATAAIPIEVPPGRAGLQPKLNLTYNSYQKNGWIGVGWNLGMGAITRSTKRGVDYNAFDFYANGQELVPVSIDGAGNGTYQARIESGFALYEFSHASGWVMTAKNGTKYYFGQDAASRQDDPGDASRVFKWCLDKVVDSNKNYMLVSYEKDQGQIYPKQIDYTGNENNSLQAPTNSVIFHYEYGRLDQTKLYTANFEVVTAYLLKTIELRVLDQLAGAYAIQYKPFEHLSSPLIDLIQQYGSDALIESGSINSGSLLNTYAMVWSENATNQLVYSSSNQTPTDTYWSDVVDKTPYHGKVFVMDINGDGKDDMVMAYQSYVSRITHIFHWLSDGNNLVYAGKSETHTDTYWSDVVDVAEFGGKVFAMDINGDGKDDLVMGYQSHVSRVTHLYHWLSDGSKLVYSGKQETPIETYWSTVVDSPDYHGKVFAMDINGDGKGDLALAYQDPTTRYTCMYFWLSDGNQLVFSSGNQTTVETYWTTVVDSPDYHGKVFAMDINGDGKGDMVMAYQSYVSRITHIFHWLSDGNNLVYAGKSETHTDTYWSDVVDVAEFGGKVFAMDINGDGKDDLVMGYQSHVSRVTHLYHWLSDGSKLVYSGKQETPIETYWSTVVDSPDYHGKVFAMDINGDGKGDLALAYQDPITRYTCMYFWLSDGNQLVFSSGNQTTVETYWSTVVDSFDYRGNVFPMDIDGDGRKDLVQAYHDPNSRTTIMYYWKCDGEFPNLLKSISNNQSATASIEYIKSSDIENKILPFILHPVSRVTVDDRNGNNSENNYSYAGGLFDHNTREFRGFKEVVRTHNDGSTLKKVFYQGDAETDDPEDQYLFKGRLNYEEARESADRSSDANLIGRTGYTWNLRTETAAAGHERAFVYLDEKVTRSFENGQAYLTVYEDNIDFDAWGNLLQSRTWDEGGSAEALTNTFEYVNYGTAADPLWRKSMDQVTGDVSGPVRQVWYRYTNDGKANLEEKEHWNDSGDNPIFRYEYDDNGNVRKEWDPKNQLIAEYTYDSATETFPEQVKNALGHTLNKSFDPRFGVVTSETDANGNTTTHHYDPFGRIVRTDLPNDGESIMAYHDDAFPRWVKKRVLESADPLSYIDTYEYFDGLGRTIQTVSVGEGGGKSVVTRIFYDSMGREKEVYGPFFVSGVAEGVLHDVPLTDVPKSWSDYDLRGRPIAGHALDGDHGTITSTVGYNGLSTTATDADGAQKTTTKDYLGRVKEVIEHTAAADLHTTYTYNAAGDLTRVRDVAGNITTIGYDSLGRKKSMTDPDMGYWQYRYDANGNLEWQKDANLKEIEIRYDVLDRITAKNYLTPTPYDHNVAYTYDDPALTAANHLGQLSRVTNGVVTTTYNDYDALGQVLSLTKTISGDTARTTAYTYDLSGKALSIVYPDNYQLNHHYYPGTGLLQSVMGLNDLVNYAAFSDYPATGKIKKAVYGNGTETTYTRDPFSTRLSAILTKDAAGAAIIDKSYMYTPAGDIEDINDAVKAVSYSYDYDKLHRLKNEINSGGSDDLAYTYNDMGGFLTKSNGSVVMSYTYDTAHIHAVKTVTVAAATYTFNYDANGNMTSGYDFTDPLNPVARTIAYNSDNMPAQIVHSANGATTFEYDGGGTRAKKTGPNGTTYYYGALFEKQGSELVKYIFAGDQRVAQVKGTAVSYFHKDHLGSSTVITDGSGAKIDEADYMPFGAQRGDGPGITVSNYGFTDQERDPETGLYNYDARLYDPVVGVFVSADTMVPYPFNSQSFNRYSYCGNNPLRYIDPTGHSYGGFGGLGIGNPGSYGGEQSVGAPGFGGGYDANAVSDSGFFACVDNFPGWTALGEIAGQKTWTLSKTGCCRDIVTTAGNAVTIDSNGSQSFSVDFGVEHTGGGDGAVGVTGSNFSNPATIDNSIQANPFSPIEIFTLSKAVYSIGKVGIKYGITAFSGRVASKSVGNLFKNGQIFERTIKTSKGPVDVMAETVVKGKTLHLKDIAIFGRDSKPLTGLTKEVLKARRALMNDAKSAGFKQLRITGVRHPTASTSANPGKVIDMTIDLTK